jgi:hypothetical protein
MTRATHRSRKASIPPIACSSPVPSPSAAADRKLFDIEAKLRKLDPRMREAGRLHNEAEEAIARWARLNPEPDIHRANAANVKEVIRDLAAWKIAEKAMLKECRFAEREAEWEKLTQQVCNIADKVLKIRATTLAGVLCKARIAKGDFGDGDQLSSSVVDDLLALQPKT